MLKEIFEQFIGAGATCLFYSEGFYLYKYNDVEMFVKTGTYFPYTPESVQELIHRDIIGIEKITIS